MNAGDLARFHAGEERLFAELVRAHSPRMLGVIRRVRADPEEAADALQEAWLRAFSRRAEVRSAASLVGWLLSISRSVAIDQVRRARVRPLHGAVPLDSDDSLPGAPFVHPVDAEEEAEHRRALEAVLELPPQQRDVVLHRLVEDRSTRETAAVLGCAEGTVKATLFQALRSLRRRLAEPTLRR